MAKIIKEEVAERIRKMYRAKKYTKTEIANLLNVSVSFINKCTVGEEKPDRSCGLGRGGGYWKTYKKFTDEQEAEMAKDYYEVGLSAVALMQKWGAHPVHVQKMRNKYSKLYGQKKRGCYANERFEELGAGVNNGNSGERAD